jgi:predicted HicB family RNase H-like nuclease
MKKKSHPSAAHYQKIVYWSDDDQVYIGQCPALFLGGVHGNDEAKVYAELCEVVEEHLETMRHDGTKAPPGDAHAFSGKLTLRIDPGLHRALALRSSATGGSLNNYIERKLAESLTV